MLPFLLADVKPEPISGLRRCAADGALSGPSSLGHNGLPLPGGGWGAQRGSHTAEGPPRSGMEQQGPLDSLLAALEAGEATASLPRSGTASLPSPCQTQHPCPVHVRHSTPAQFMSGTASLPNSCQVQHPCPSQVRHSIPAQPRRLGKALGRTWHSSASDTLAGSQSVGSLLAPVVPSPFSRDVLLGQTLPVSSPQLLPELCLCSARAGISWNV